MLLHIGKGRSNLVMSLTMFASKRVVTHCLVTLPYLVVTPGKSAGLARRRSRHHSGSPFCMLQPCGPLQCPSLKCPVGIKFPLHLNHYRPQSFLRRRHQGNQSGAALDCRNHPKMTRCQTLTWLGSSC